MPAPEMKSEGVFPFSLLNRVQNSRSVGNPSRAATSSTLSVPLFSRYSAQAMWNLPTMKCGQAKTSSLICAKR